MFSIYGNMNSSQRNCDKASRDPILVALAQNGALRLQCDGAFISSMQGRSSFIVAEAKISSSLCSAQAEPSATSQAEEESYLGRLLAQSSVFFAGPAPSVVDTHNVSANHLRNTTGQVVGCYAVTANQTRDDFFAQDTHAVLVDIASTIAHYFDRPYPQNSHSSRSNDQELVHHGTSQSASTTSDWSPSQASSVDNITPLTAPSEPAEYPFNAKMPSHDLTTSSIRNRASDSRDTLSSTVPRSPDNRIITAEEATKSDFVSSLSHELRSPLHGCLAAVELLQKSNLDNAQSNLLSMIQACSSTLLYTLNHLLDYSKVNDLENLPSNRPSDLSASKAAAGHNTFGETSQDYLCRLAQDVVEGVFFGHSMQQAAYDKMQQSPPDYQAESHADPAMLLDDTMGSMSATNPHTPEGVAVFLYMESSAAWFSIISAGAWKRLIMNLFGNSLKFCSAGHIEVTLRLVLDQADPTKRMARLVVNDTGIGMSESFIKHGLYQPFVQENHLIAGTGLGLNIVKHIVDDMQGTINVKSTLGSGTRFDVHIPIIYLDAPSENSNSVLDGGQVLDPKGLLRGLTICLLSSTAGSNDRPDSRTSLVHSYVKNIAIDWYHMDVTSVDMAAEVEADFYIAEASDFTQHARSNAHTSQAALKQRTILVGTPLQLNEARRESAGNFIGLTYPLGPKALLRALHAALEELEKSDYPAMPAAVTNITPNSMDIDLTDPQPSSSCDVEMEVKPRDATKEHVLLVDDNAINLRLLSTFVKKLNMPAETAVDGADALARYTAMSATSPFSTILMDISMPNMNGFESSRAIRKFEVEHGIPPAKIIALTALSSEASRREAELSGIDDFQMKPVSLKTLKGLFPGAT